MQKQSDRRAGTRVQQKMKKILREKQAALKTKFNTYQRLVNSFSSDFPQEVGFECPTFEDMRALSVYDAFWDIGQVTHPTEAWAVDQKTQDGIQAHLSMTHALDELSRLARECRQMVKWALDVDEKASFVRGAVASEDMSLESISNKWMMQTVKSNKPRECDRLIESKEVLRSVLVHISHIQSRLWITWDSGMLKALNQTVQYSHLSAEDERALRNQWNGLVIRARETWKDITQAPILEAEPLDEGVAEEMQMMEQADEMRERDVSDLDESDFDGAED
ncbi:hypothetical protein DFH28DRAFT_1088614 [Melampsora americana]|nr:hypothetical protein DFH28DRAFT_1088614 [Melampsora americana]